MTVERDEPLLVLDDTDANWIKVYSGIQGKVRACARHRRSPPQIGYVPTSFVGEQTDTVRVFNILILHCRPQAADHGEFIRFNYGCFHCNTGTRLEATVGSEPVQARGHVCRRRGAQSRY